MEPQDEPEFQIGTIYSPEEDPFARQKLIDGWRQERLRNAQVLVVGAGALGNEVLKNLALMGIGGIFIIDSDIIESSNLSRTVLFRKEDQGHAKAETAAKRTRQLCIEESTTVHSLNADVNKIGDGLFRRMNVVIGCLDNVEARLAISRGSWLAGIPWVDGGIAGFRGNITVYHPNHSGCYQCRIGQEDFNEMDKRYSCDLRKKASYAEGKVAAIQTISATIAAMQVQEVLRLLHDDLSMVGHNLSYNGQEGVLHNSRFIQTNSHEKHHGNYPAEMIISLADATASMTLNDFFTIAEKETSSNNLTVQLPSRRRNIFVTYAKCNNCGHRVKVNRPLFEIDAYEYNVCPACGIVQQDGIQNSADLTIQLDGQSTFTRNTDIELLAYQLYNLGFSSLDIVPVKDVHDKYYYFELTKDTASMFGHSSY